MKILSFLTQFIITPLNHQTNNLSRNSQSPSVVVINKRKQMSLGISDYMKKAPKKMTAVKIVTPEYWNSCQKVVLVYLCFFQCSFGLAIPVFGSLSNSCSLSGIVGGQIAYLIGSQQAVTESNHNIGGQKACVSR